MTLHKIAKRKDQPDVSVLSLKKGTKIKIGNEDAVLAADADIQLSNELTDAAVYDLLEFSGNSDMNLPEDADSKKAAKK